jgi:hypothetical protein
MKKISKYQTLEKIVFKINSEINNMPPPEEAKEEVKEAPPAP